MDLALNNLQWLICYKIKQNQNKLITSDKQGFPFLVFFSKLSFKTN